MKLNEFLKKSNLTQAAFGKMVGSSPVAVSCWSRGLNKPRPNTMKEIKKVTHGVVKAEDFSVLSEKPSLSKKFYKEVEFELQPKLKDVDEYLKVSTAADYLSINRQSLDTAVLRGELKSVLIDGIVHIRKDWLVTYGLRLQEEAKKKLEEKKQVSGLVPIKASYTVKEAADLTGMSIDWFYKHIYKGEIKWERQEDAYHISHDEICRIKKDFSCKVA